MINYSLSQLLKTLVEQRGSDLHVSAFSPPRVRIDGSLVPLQVEALSSEDAKNLCFSAISDAQREILEKNKELDLAFTVTNLARFRANIFLQRGHISGVFRVIPSKIKTLDEIQAPPIFKEICDYPRGLVLVTGPTGSGKSTTLAAMIDYINSTRREHIVTIEDPIEFVHPHKTCLINQRELGDDTKSFTNALKSVLRQDPDVVLVGELRDLETIGAAITTTETGHLVFGTLHTNGCVQSINRIIDVFPPHQQGQIRVQLSMNIAAIASQMLIPMVNGGRALAMEVMVANGAIRALIGEGKFNQIYSYLQSGQAGSGMMTMNQSLLNLLNARKITQAIAMEYSPDATELQSLIERRSGVRKSS
jgi:twitching motility protein PilT